MKKRIITAIVAVAYAIVALLLNRTPIIILSLSIFAIISMFELAKVMKVKSKTVKIISAVYAALVPIFMSGEAAYKNIADYFGWNNNIPFNVSTVWRICIIAYVLTMLIAMLEHYKTMKFEEMATMIFGALAISYGLGLLGKFTFIDYYFAGFSHADGMFLIVYALVVCWTFDGGAYFIGRKLGKHKMAKNISPKKSWEGYFGGILVSEICSVGFYFLYYYVITGGTADKFVSCLAVAIASPFLSTLSILGDLSASTIKRNFGAKDFGNFFPGHGGVLDRFDSVLYVTPILYVLISLTVIGK